MSPSAPQRPCLQAEAEKKAADAAKEGLHRKLAEAEARVSSMLDTVEDLQAGLAQQQQEAGARYSLVLSAVEAPGPCRGTLVCRWLAG